MIREVRGHILFRHDAEFSAGRMSEPDDAPRVSTSSETASLRAAREKLRPPSARSARFYPADPCGETIGWAEATAEPVFLIRLLDAQAERCPLFHRPVADPCRAPAGLGKQLRPLQFER